jgi:predicted  nucleic acid-binding Zn-ribbon protein
MTGGADSEDLRSVKTNAPKYLHADKAVVVDDDFDALTDSFQDPVLGAVAKAKAFRVDEYEKDLETVSKARFVRKRIDEAVGLSESGVGFLSDLLDDFEVFPDSSLEASISGQTYEDLVEFIEESGLLESYFDQMDDTIDDIRRIRLEAEATLSELENIPTQVKNDANDIDEKVSQIRQEVENSDTIGTTTKQNILNDLDIIESSTSEIRTSVSSNLIGRRVQEVITKIDTLVTEYDTLLQSRSTLDATLTQLQRYVDGFKSELEDQGDIIESLIRDTLEGTSDETGFKELVERLKEARDRLNGLKDHLSDIYESECGPNLITVPILTYDEDEFFAPPSLGLINSLEDYLEERSEPSVVINVTDGSEHIVRPAIDVYFKSETNFSDLDVRERIKERLLSNLRDRDFGQDLYLGGREGVHEFGDNIQGIDFINFEITGHIPANPPAWMNPDQSDIEPRPNVEIDGQGNLLIPDKNIISRPIDPDTGNTLLRFFVKQSPTDTPQQI